MLFRSKKEAERAKAVANKLQRNLEILKALEAEYDTEQANRKTLNDKLESEGYNTMKDKMAALHEKALKMKEVAEKIIAFTSSTSKVTFEAPLLFLTSLGLPSIARARDVLGWLPLTRLDDGLKKTIEYFDTLLRTNQTLPA